jgi:hypothetical protein
MSETQRVASASTTLAAVDDSYLGPLAASAAYLGLKTEQLQVRLQGGETLAGVAVARGRPVSGLEEALLENLKTDLDADVATGRITSAREAEILADARVRIAAQVARVASRARGP